MKFLQTYKVPILLGVLLVGGWLFLRTSATPLESVDDLDARLATGQPIVLEFFTNT